MKNFIFVFIALVLFSSVPLHAQLDFDDKVVGEQPDGSIVVPTNQILRPAGLQIFLPGRPVDLALSPDERLLAVKNRKSLDLIRIQDRTILQSLPYGRSGASFTGLEFNRDGRRIYVTEAEDRIHIARLEGTVMQWEEPIILPEPEIGGAPVPGGLKLSADEAKIYVTLSRNNTLAVVDFADSNIQEIPVGIAPYDVLLYSDSKVYVTNWGGRRPVDGEHTGPTSGSEVLVDEETGIANNGTVSVVDLSTMEEVNSIEVGLHPGEMVFSPDKTRLYVACANSDVVSVIDTRRDRVISNIQVNLDKDLPFGSAPNALSISPDGKYLYVANGTDNAICVIKTGRRNRVQGYIPTGWYPGGIRMDSKGELLFVANTKGIGSRNRRTDRPGYNSHDHLGTVSIIPVPDSGALEDMTTVVEENNSLAHLKQQTRPQTKNRETVPVPYLPGQKSHFKHVLYIIKENRTYDQIFGDMKQGNGEPELVLFGREVTPNHHKLAEEFVLMDNFYCSGILSADGHQWTDEAYVTDYIEKFFGDFTRSYPYDGDDALAYASSGFIWDNVLRHNLTFRDYGEFVNAVIEPSDATFSDMYNDYKNGTRNVKIGATANIETLEPYICPTFPGFPNSIPEVYRAKEFIKELQEFEANDNFPNFIIMLLPNDHTSGTRPGRPTPRAAVADNDLALGQIVESVSRSKFWKETCILVTEDDPQAGLDHVDGHRTVGFVISPYTKRGEVVSTHYTQINMMRTIENILGLPPMNQFDLTAEPMLDCFNEQPDYSPYEVVPNNIPLDELNPELESLRGEALYWAQKSIEQDLRDVDRIEEDTFNRIIWHAVKGYNVPYPEIAGN